VGPKPPDFLDAVAFAKWNELSARIPFVANELDSLAAYCAAYSRWRGAEEQILADGGPILTVIDDKGNVKSCAVSPRVLLAERSQKEMARLGKILKLGRIVRQNGCR
jgi:phage terminase small subunit